MRESALQIIEASIDDVSVLRNLLQLYVYDFSEIEGYDLNEHGLYKYRYLDNYWSEEDRYQTKKNIPAQIFKPRYLHISTKRLSHRRLQTLDLHIRQQMNRIEKTEPV